MKVQVERVLYDSPDTGFHICKAAVLEATQEDMIPKALLGSLETLTIKGYFPVNKIVNLLVKGSWEKSKYGYALVVNEFKEIIPPTKDGIIAYLSATVYGIKESMAKKIVGQFGLQTLEVFENSPEQLLTVKGIGRQRLQKIIDSYKDSRSIQEIVSYLAPLGVTANKCAKIAKAFGGEAMNVLLNEPFRLCEIEGFGFLIVDQIARKTTFSLTDPMRICGAIRYVLQAAATEGHLCYRQLECICYAYLLLNDVDYKCASIVKAVNEFIDTNNPLCLRQYVPDAKVPMTLVIEHFKTMALGYELKGDNGFVYLPFEYEQEVDIADIIAKRLTQNRQQTISDEEIAKAIMEKEQDLKIQLAEKQKEAVALGVKENTCIITGGPGVGKTTVLKVVLSVCLQFGKLKSSDVTLLAPTGRAAQRMAESVGGDYTASTIHSALKIGGDDMRTFEPLDSKIVVVDEASMVDSHICWLLLNAVPDDAKLILIGDPEQLPSVGAGNVLFEFLNCQRIPTVRLDVIYRQAGTNSIVTNAGLIQQGVTKLTYDDDFRFFDVHATEDFPASDKERGKKIQSEARDIVIEQFVSAVKSDGLDEVQVLCPFRKKGVIAGATELNKEIQQRLNPPSYGKPEIKRGDRIFRLGDKVIQTKNNRDIGIFNGDVGYIKRIDTAEDEIIISFNGSDVTIDSTQLADLDLAYAISIHKAQGSEYNQIIIPIITAFSIMLKRNLIYTGITRAKKKVILVGHKRALAQAIRTNVIAKRNTQLGRRIIASINKISSRGD